MDPHEITLRDRLEEPQLGRDLRDDSGYSPHFNKEVLIVSRDDTTDNNMKECY